MYKCYQTVTKVIDVIYFSIVERNSKLRPYNIYKMAKEQTDVCLKKQLLTNT